MTRAGVCLALVLLAGCAAERGGAAGGGAERVPARVGSVVLQVELAATPEQREAGLRGRSNVPPGTGMAFRYDGPRPVRFTMAGVDLPLVAVFARAGRVVSVEQLAPCAGSVERCPLYGPDEPVDVVVEAAPGTLAAVRPGDSVAVG